MAFMLMLRLGLRLGSGFPTRFVVGFGLGSGMRLVEWRFRLGNRRQNPRLLVAICYDLTGVHRFSPREI